MLETVKSIGKMTGWQKGVPKTRMHGMARMRRTVYEGTLVDRAVVSPLSGQFTAHRNTLRLPGNQSGGFKSAAGEYMYEERSIRNKVIYQHYT